MPKFPFLKIIWLLKLQISRQFNTKWLLVRLWSSLLTKEQNIASQSQYWLEWGWNRPEEKINKVMMMYPVSAVNIHGNIY